MYYTQWLKSDDDELWHFWSQGTSPPGNPPVCETVLTVTQDVFEAVITLTDMCSKCKRANQLPDEDE